MFSSTTIGAQYPHCRMLSATASTASSLILGLLSYGLISTIGTRLSSILSSPFVFSLSKNISPAPPHRILM